MRERAFRQGRTSWVDDLIFRVRAGRVLAQLPAESGVLVDLGSGYDFRFLRLALRMGRISAGIALDIAVAPPPEGSSIRTMVADLSHPLPIETSSASAATSLAVLEHLHDPRLHVTEILRILKPGGVLILTTPTTRAKPILELLAYRLRLIDAGEIRDHKHYFTQLELRELLTSVGFDASTLMYRSFSLGMNQIVTARKPLNDEREP